MEIIGFAGRREPNMQDIVVDGKLMVGVPADTVMVESSSDLQDLTEYAPGSIAFTAGYKNVWQLNSTKTLWKDLIGSSDVEIETE